MNDYSQMFAQLMARASPQQATPPVAPHPMQAQLAQMQRPRMSGPFPNMQNRMQPMGTPHMVDYGGGSYMEALGRRR